jgi:hypothetical protein
MAYPENVVAQWILEWGLPFGLAGLVTVAWALKPSAVLARSATASGAWAAVVALTAQNLGDLASEIPGVVFAGAVCAAIVVAGTPGHRSRWRVEHWGGSPSVVAVVAAAATVGGVIAAVTGLGHELHDDQGALYEAAMDHHVSSRVMRGVERAAMLRHPAEPYLPFAAALKASTERNDNVIPWIAATFERASVYGPAHLIRSSTSPRCARHPASSVDTSKRWSSYPQERRATASWRCSRVQSMRGCLPPGSDWTRRSQHAPRLSRDPQCAPHATP